MTWPAATKKTWLLKQKYRQYLSAALWLLNYDLSLGAIPKQTTMVQFSQRLMLSSLRAIGMNDKRDVKTGGFPQKYLGSVLAVNFSKDRVGHMSQSVPNLTGFIS